MSEHQKTTPSETFPVALQRPLSMADLSLLAGRKRTRVEFGKQGDIVVLAVNDHDMLVVESAGDAAIISLLAEVRDLLKINNALLEKQR